MLPKLIADVKTRRRPSSLLLFESMEVQLVNLENDIIELNIILRVIKPLQAIYISGFSASRQLCQSQQCATTIARRM